MKAISVAIFVLGLTLGTAQAEEPYTLIEGTWVCVTPEAYDQAVAAAQREGQSLQALKQELRDQKLCMYVDDEHLEDLMAPYVKILERQGDKTKVSFSVEYYRRIATLHRKITRVTYAGWTATANIKSYYQ